MTPKRPSRAVVLPAVLLALLTVPAPVPRAGAALGSGELDAGELGVGVEVVDPGSPPVTRDAGEASLPRLVHYVATPLRSETLGSLENLCDASGAAVTGPTGIVFGWLHDVIAYTSDGRVISDTHECVPFPDPNDHSTVPPPPPLPYPRPSARCGARSRFRVRSSA